MEKKVDLLRDDTAQYLKEIEFTRTWSVSHHVRFLMMANFAIQMGSKKILDVGFGNGLLPTYLDNMDYDGGYVGIDLNQNYVDLCKDKKFGFTTQFRFGDVASVKEKFDCVVLGEVIEHVDVAVVDKFLKDVSDHFIKDGFLIVSTPNKHDNKVNWPEDHVSEFSYEELMSVLNKEFELIDVFGLWCNSKDTRKFLSSDQRQLYDYNSKFFPRSILNVFANLSNPVDSRHLIAFFKKKAKK